MEIQETIQAIARGTAEIINIESLRTKLQDSRDKKRPLRVKAGFDPTTPDIHLGHVVLLRKLRQFQDLGHRVDLLIGDFTARIGDPSGRDQMRPKMDKKSILRNAQTYKSQVFKILNPKKTKVVFNGTWLAKMNAQDILELSSYSTVAQMLARADFKKRYEQKKEISILEFVYPLLQGYDSVYLKADIELGGSDQKFNLLMGRQLQEAFGQAQQVVIMMPLLEGLDGVQKMSKSLGNYIGVTESPKEIFGKVMSVSDDLMFRYYELLTDMDLDEAKRLHPKEAKLRLAQEIVRQFHDADEAKKSRVEFEQVFSQGQVPVDMETYYFDNTNKEYFVDVIIKMNLASSKNEIRRLLRQGAVTFEGQRIDSEHWEIQEGVLKIGKRRFLRFSPSPQRNP
ncbi:MAG: tyrosine--tRNA ligase [Candidatus Omnitrophota bacterium]